jgi:hypothetical protein
MAQNLTIEDVVREVDAVFANGGRFCEAHKGMTYCDRFEGHHGKHATADQLRLAGDRLYPTRLTRW